MATSTSIAIKARTQANDSTTTTINYVNPGATSEQLQSLASAMNDLTTNTIDTVTRIDKAVLGSEIDKLSRNLKAILYDDVFETEVTTLSQAQLPTETWNYEMYSAFILQYDGDLALSDITVSMSQLAETVSGAGYIGVVVCEQTVTKGGEQVNVYVVGISKTTAPSSNVVGASVTVHLPETDTYQAASLTITIAA